MIVSALALLAALLPQPPAAAAPSPSPSPSSTPAAAAPWVVSVLDERTDEDLVLRFVLSGPPSSYSATREGNEVVVRIAAEALPGMTLPVARPPLQNLSLSAGSPFTFKVSVADERVPEMVREMASLRLVLRKPEAMSVAPANAGAGVPKEPEAPPSATAARRPARAAEPEADTADLYARLFPTAANPNPVDTPTDLGKPENWYSDFTWLGLQARPWVSTSYIDGKSTQVQSNTVTSDAYMVIQPNLGLGLSPQFGGPRGGQWKINYTPRFRRLVDLNLPHLTSHFFDIGLDQPVASFGSVYGSYHYSKGVLETEEIDAGQEYGIGLNRVLDSSLQQFRRNSFGFGVRADLLTDTQIDINVGRTTVDYGNPAGEATVGERAFFDYETRTLNASVRRGAGDSRFIGLVFGIHDTPKQERAQVQGRGYNYGATLEGSLAALTTGRLLFGYRTQKNPGAGAGGQDYKDINYGAQVVRELSEDRTIGLSADRKLYLSAYADNGFYVADSIRGDLKTRVPFGAFLQGSLSFQSNNYRASPKSNTAAAAPVLRQDKIRFWSLGLARTLRDWVFIRLDYISQRRDSNLDRFDLRSRAFTAQVGFGFFGKGNGQAQPTW